MSASERVASGPPDPAAHDAGPTGAKPLLAFYGDDFTGSSAVMEVMSFAGLPTVLFLEAPSPERLEAFRGYSGIGIAGTARAETPEWMDGHLPGLFRALQALGAPFNQYKVCSTFDSAPRRGSIGRAIDLGAAVFRPRCIPLVVAAPPLGRYQAFGNLFAAYGGAIHRLDRHPAMSRHATTPMNEADLGRHLAGQTDRRIELLDLAGLVAQADAGPAADPGGLQRGDDCPVVSLDMTDTRSMTAAGAVLTGEAAHGPVFCAGSQGIEYALIAHWRAHGLLPPEAEAPAATARERIVAVSGSVSPNTANQIADAEANGFAVIPVEVARLGDDSAWTAHLDECVATGGRALAEGRSPLLVTARGPEDPAVDAFAEVMDGAGADRAQAQAKLARDLGRCLARLVRENGIDRAVISGGDTSSYGASELGIYALSAAAPIAPGAPLCRVFTDDPANPLREIALKGGQMGGADYFRLARDGR